MHPDDAAGRWYAKRLLVEELRVIEIDESRWPLVAFTFGGEVTARELDAYLAAADRMLATGEQYIGIVYARDVRPWDSALVRRQADWMKANEPGLRRASLGVALVLPSLMLRGLLRAVLWLQPMPQPHVVCASTAEAMTWIDERLHRAGLELPVACSLGA